MTHDLTRAYALAEAKAAARADCLTRADGPLLLDPGLVHLILVRTILPPMKPRTLIDDLMSFGREHAGCGQLDGDVARRVASRR